MIPFTPCHIPIPWTHLKLARVLLQEFLAIGQVLPGLGSEGRGDPLPAAQLHLRQNGGQGSSSRGWQSLQAFPSSPQASWHTPHTSHWLDSTGPGLAFYHQSCSSPQAQVPPAPSVV